MVNLGTSAVPDYSPRMSSPRESEFFHAVAQRKIPRIRVAAIVIHGGRLLVQQPADDPSACYALIGGEYEMGDTCESRLRKEFEEETTAKVVSTEYLFLVENRFLHEGELIQAVELYFRARIDTSEVSSREPHLTQHWLPVERLRDYNLRPLVVRDAIFTGDYLTVKHLVVPEGA